MKLTGLMRKPDYYGRLVLPAEIRYRLNIKIKDPIEISVEDDMIVLTKYDEKNTNNSIVRKIDDVGRIVIPKEIRTALKLDSDGGLLFFLKVDKILIKSNDSNKCMITGEKNDDNFVLENGKIVLSKLGAEILIKELKNFYRLN